MNPEFHAEVTVRANWNAMEATILAEIYGAEKYPQDADYTLHDMMTLNGDVARAMNPDDDSITVPEQFFDRDRCGTYRNPMKTLFERTETLLANFDRLQGQMESFDYDREATL